MRQTLVVLLALAASGINAFQPNTPKFMPPAREAPIKEAATASFDDFLLENTAIPTDNTITAARKCGFCMGASNVDIFFHKISRSNMLP